MEYLQIFQRKAIFGAALCQSEPTARLEHFFTGIIALHLSSDRVASGKRQGVSFLEEFSLCFEISKGYSIVTSIVYPGISRGKKLFRL